MATLMSVNPTEHEVPETSIIVMYEGKSNENLKKYVTACILQICSVQLYHFST
jgi:hypothetical protein